MSKRADKRNGRVVVTAVIGYPGTIQHSRMFTRYQEAAPGTEGVIWVRGFHARDSKVVRALLAAYALASR